MSRAQPTLREARASLECTERLIASAVECYPLCSRLDRAHFRGPRVEADGVVLRFSRQRHWLQRRWPVSEIHSRCDTCNCVLRDRRDAGSGFRYDARWLTGNPAERDPTHGEWIMPVRVCLPCFNRARPKVDRAVSINETRLMIGRIKRETRNANQDIG